MYLDNKYTRRYYFIINRGIARNFKTRKEASASLGYVERHHVIPKSIGGSNDSTNLVFLSGREHFICHWLLVKMTHGDHHHSMIFALNGMKRKNNKQHRYNTKITSRVYSKYKAIAGNIRREKQTGVPQSKESNQKRSKTQTGVSRGGYNKTLYTFYHHDGRVVTCSCYELYNNYGANQGNLAKMVIDNSSIKCDNGWSLSKEYAGKRGHNQRGLNNPASDQTIYVFYNIKTNITEYLTQHELKIKYDLCKSNVSAICNKRQKSYKGWTII